MKKLLADDIITIFGQITPPISGMPTDAQTGVVRILNVALNMVIIVTGIFALWNLVNAGFNYVTAGGDPKKVEDANRKITFTVLGLLIVVISVVVAGIFGIILFGRWDAILNPTFKSV